MKPAILTVTPHKFINVDVYDKYNEIVKDKYNNAVARNIKGNYVWSQDGRGQIASLKKEGDKIIFEMT